MPTTLYRRAFNRAAEILGGEERLARYLNAEHQELRNWKHRGRAPVEALELVAMLLKQQLLKKYRTRSRSH